jgi:signal peptidase I
MAMTTGSEFDEPTTQDPGVPPRPPQGDAGGEGARTTRRRRPLVIVGSILAGLVLVAILAGVLLGVTHSSYYIPSRSMAPTLEPGDRILVDEASDASRGDIVVVQNPDGPTAGRVPTIVKRVIGLPGETVVIDQDQVIIDGHPLSEPYLADGTVTQSIGPHGCPPSDPCVIPEGDMWLMGDNRGDSKDSRYFGPVPESTIKGRADFRYWPVDRVGSL